MGDNHQVANDAANKPAGLAPINRNGRAEEVVMGTWIVRLSEPLSPNRCDLEIVPGNDSKPAEMQFALRIKKTISVLRTALMKQSDHSVTQNCLNWIKRNFSKTTSNEASSVRELRFLDYVRRLHSIAASGLQNPAKPELAQMSLDALIDEVVRVEGPGVKNHYMRKLGIWAALLFALGIAPIAFNLLPAKQESTEFSKLIGTNKNVLLVFAGAMLGCWLSFGIRRVELGFEHLGQVEADMLRPALRLLFVGFLAIGLSWIFLSKMIVITIGLLSTDALQTNALTALVIGLLCGVGEQALPTTLSKQADNFLSKAAVAPSTKT